jgi:hypothetical protein
MLCFLHLKVVQFVSIFILKKQNKKIYSVGHFRVMLQSKNHLLFHLLCLCYLLNRVKILR